MIAAALMSSCAAADVLEAEEITLCIFTYVNSMTLSDSVLNGLSISFAQSSLKQLFV